uniref:Uncharacterized protein n=1 Tax=Wuchereria bancrofti TaxID=6293 RepID=A0AAF5PJJ9_WUCBA
MRNLQSSTTFFCNIQDNPSYLSGSGTNSGHACCDTSLTSILSPYHFRNWELDPSTALSQSFDHCEIFGTFYDNFITPSPVLNQTASELYVHNEEQQITMNTNAACNLEKLLQRLETATLRLEALGAQKPMLAPKPTRNDASPAPSVP